MKVGVTGTGVLALAALVGGGIIAWQAYRRASAAADSIAGTLGSASQWVSDGMRGVQDAATMAMAEARQAWGNATGLQEPGDPVRAALYSDAGYAGIDTYTGREVSAGEWYSNPEALAYDYTQRDAGNAPAATSIDGAAFGVYPKARRSSTGRATIQPDPWDSILNRKAYAY